MLGFVGLSSQNSRISKGQLWSISFINWGLGMNSWSPKWDCITGFSAVALWVAYFLTGGPIPLTQKRRLLNEVSAFLNSKKPWESKTTFVYSSDLPTSRPHICFLHPWCLPPLSYQHGPQKCPSVYLHTSSQVCSLTRYELARACSFHPPWQYLSEGVGTWVRWCIKNVFDVNITHSPPVCLCLSSEVRLPGRLGGSSTHC